MWGMALSAWFLVFGFWFLVLPGGRVGEWVRP
jgi:hypothetical protein